MMDRRRQSLLAVDSALRAEGAALANLYRAHWRSYIRVQFGPAPPEPRRRFRLSPE